MRAAAVPHRQHPALPMRVRLVRVLLAPLLAALLPACAPLPPAAEGFRLTVLHTNDHHGRAFADRDGAAGLAARKTLIDGVRAELAREGGAVLLLDAGDVNTGAPESDLLDAEPDFRGMTLAGYDAMAVGNHEFDKTPAVLARQREAWSGFPWLSANVQREGRPLFEPYRVFQRGPLRIAVLGLTTDETRRLGIERRHPGVQIGRPADAAKRWLPGLRRQADVVVVLSHLGHDAGGDFGSAEPGDVSLAREVSGIDLIVGGHSHSLVCMAGADQRLAAWQPGQPCRPDRQNGAWIVQAGDRGRYVGRADFEWRGGRLELRAYTLLPVNLRGVSPAVAAPLAPDAAMARLLEPLAERGRQGLSVAVGRTVGLFDGAREQVRHRPTTLGRLVTEAMREATGADLALTSAGGLRDSLPEGALTLRDLLQALPFGNRIVTVDMRGDELAAYLLQAARKTPGTGAYAQVSGARWHFDGQALHELQVGGQPLQPARRYRLALNSFVAGGGDGYPDLRQHPGHRDSGWADVPMLRHFIERRGGVIHAADFAPVETAP